MNSNGSALGALASAGAEALPDPMLVVTRAGELLYANAAGLRAMRFSVGSGMPTATAQSLDAHVQLSPPHRWRALCEQAAAGTPWRHRLQLGTVEGGWRAYEANAVPLAMPGLEPAVVLVCRESPESAGLDPTLSDAAALAQARLAALVSSCEDAIVGKTLDGIITSWNAGAERLFGYSAQEAIGQSILLIVPEARRTEEAGILRHLQQGERIEHFETQRLTKDGQLIEVSLTVSPIRDAQGRLVGASKVARDIGERRRMAEAQERMLEAERFAREQAERASGLKDEFLSVLSHELRTPLSVIQAWGHLLAAGKAEAAEMPKAGAVILRNATLQKAVIDDLLDVNRIVSGNLRMELQTINPLACVHAALELIAAPAAAKGIHVLAELNVADAALRADAARLQQVLGNLLSNAVKFTPYRGEIRVKMEQKLSQLQISVADNGVGIDALFLPRVFERFAQEDFSTSRRHSGLGLGLAIAKHLVEMHGGSLIADSRGKGCGATFTLTLPLASEGTSAAAAVPRAGERQRTGEGSDLAGLNVLVVDDEPDARQLMSRILSDSGAAVRAADCAGTALSMIRTCAPHVLISDISMPGTDGYELLRLVRNLEGPVGQLPAIALTALSRPSDRMHALHAGYMAHLVKPADPTQLVAIVMQAARSARGRLAPATLKSER